MDEQTKRAHGQLTNDTVSTYPEPCGKRVMYSHKDETKWNMYYMNIYMIWRKWTKKFKILNNAIKWKVIKYEK